MNKKHEQREMTFDFDGLIQLLAKHLYADKKIFIRELIQNAHDAIQRRAAKQPNFELSAGYIDIVTDLSVTPACITFRDNGIGMTESDLDDFLATIGRSGTLVAREAEHVPDVIGQFGIGFLSGFVVGGKIEVRTRHIDEKDASNSCLWENDGRKEYKISRCHRDTAGTDVTIFLRSAEDNGVLHESIITQVVRAYADMLLIPIHVNDTSHRKPALNTRYMPWERTGLDDAGVSQDCLIYLEKTVPDSVLEVIPVNEDDDSGPKISGLLYITRTRVVGRDAPRIVRVFLKRMFLCENAKDLLPSWATFVNGILNTPALSPNAARDNFARDAQFERLRDRLGEIIVAHFESLKKSNPSRLSEILVYHDLAIKSACHYYDPFFEKFGHLLEWRINGQSPAAKPGRERQFADESGRAGSGWATLPEIIAVLPKRDTSGRRHLPCFQQSSSANQYFEIADATRSTVVDASSLFEIDLLRSYAERHSSQLRLVYVDREDDPSVFEEIDADADKEVQRLASEMSAFLRPGGTGRVRVEARRFKPSSLPAVLKYSDGGQSAEKARSYLTDPNAPADLRRMAEEMIKLSRNSDMRMMINAANGLIRKLAALDLEDGDVRDLMLGVYNDAILYNAELMTPRNAQLFHEQFQRLMMRSLDFVHQKAEIARSITDLALERARLHPPRGPSRDHKVAFLMTPFSPDFRSMRAAIRIVVEDRLGCELRTADEATYAQFIHGNVKVHIDDADFFIADVTDRNPNVMLELGAVLYGGRNAPTLLLARVQKEEEKPDLPADLQGAIAAVYLATEGIDATANRLGRQFEAHNQLSVLLPKSSQRFVSQESVALLLQNAGITLPADTVQTLSRSLPTTAAWTSVKEEEIGRLLGARHVDLAPIVLKRVREHLNI
jgi:molecular chaperone HtpG